MHKSKLNFLAAALAGGIAAAPLAAANVVESKLVNKTAIKQHVAIEQQVNQDGEIRGLIRNRSNETIEDIEVLVRYSWVWAKPSLQSDDNPSWVDFVTLKADLKPGDALPFEYELGKPLDKRGDGSFLPSAEVVAVTTRKTRSN